MKPTALGFFCLFFAAYAAGRLGQHQLVRTQTPGQGEMVSGITARRFLVLATGLVVGGGLESLATCARPGRRKCGNDGVMAS